MARLSDSYTEFTLRGVEILALGPDKEKTFISYWREHQIPFIGLPDPQKTVLRLYNQEVNLFKLGRMPMNTIVDLAGHIRFVHYGMSMADIPDNETFLEVIDKIAAPSE